MIEPQSAQEGESAEIEKATLVVPPKLSGMVPLPASFVFPLPFAACPFPFDSTTGSVGRGDSTSITGASGTGGAAAGPADGAAAPAKGPGGAPGPAPRPPAAMPPAAPPALGREGGPPPPGE